MRFTSAASTSSWMRPSPRSAPYVCALTSRRTPSCTRVSSYQVGAIAITAQPQLIAVMQAANMAPNSMPMSLCSLLATPCDQPASLCAPLVQSGDILHLIDAGHAKLVREDGHVETFCATCSQAARAPPPTRTRTRTPVAPLCLTASPLCVSLHLTLDPQHTTLLPPPPVRQPLDQRRQSGYVGHDADRRRPGSSRVQRKPRRPSIFEALSWSLLCPGL